MSTKRNQEYHSPGLNCEEGPFKTAADWPYTPTILKNATWNGSHRESLWKRTDAPTASSASNGSRWGESPTQTTKVQHPRPHSSGTAPKARQDKHQSPGVIYANGRRQHQPREETRGGENAQTVKTSSWRRSNTAARSHRELGCRGPAKPVPLPC
jgi:hypothetical protein